MAEPNGTEPHRNEPTLLNIEDDMRQSYLDYAMSVNIGRALPQIRDGLKPVHRRILYAMFREGLLANRRYSKCAGVVGEVLKHYHPHGDMSVYDALVRMAQPFSLRYPLIDGQGNFGSVDGDPPAAYRYTECRLTRLAERMLADIDKDTVDFVDNYDGSFLEPDILPSQFPNLLVNGSDGIAVGMATNIPPHNLTEVIDALAKLIEKPSVTLEEILDIIPGPDFPTGGQLLGKASIRQAYLTGRGSLIMRALAAIETDKRSSRASIIVREIPYQVNKARLIERMAELVNDKRIEGISDLRDESDRDGMRIVIELKRDAEPRIVLNQLYKLTQMQQSYGIILLGIHEGRPKEMNLLQMLQAFLEHRKIVLTRRTRFELKEAEARLHILDGLLIALINLDAVIALIRKSKDAETARSGLMGQFSLTQIQAQAILDLTLRRLTSLERDKIETEHKETVALIGRLKKILSDEKELLKLIAGELEDIKKEFGDARRTQIVEAEGDFSIEDLIVEEDNLVTITHGGYIKRTPLSLYRTQKRGGRGKIGATTTEEDFVEHLERVSTHDRLLFFTSAGKVYQLKAYELPEGGRAAKGRSIANLLSLANDETLAAFIPAPRESEGKFVFFSTRRGRVKKTALDEYENIRRNGIIAINLEDGDTLVDVRITDGNQQIVLSTRDGQAIRFKEEEARPMGRATAGVGGMELESRTLKDGKTVTLIEDEVVSMSTVRDDETLLTMSELGYGKRTPASDYRLTHRGGKGVITMHVTEKTGPVISVRQVGIDDQMMLITDSGKVIRLAVKGVRITGRNAQGVHMVRLEGDERVRAVAKLLEGDDEYSNGNGADDESEE
ncbi:MAG: DNA gyrase subunit A [Candidatus Binatus sp.]|uniref:DNA gyrase subunit A n=1 Tax=Candidatus Binatus sp. TaxID=2811406 RepID=UPI002718523A|nr:DNA gyrase subunit A [Candidatus Binatus sp.]MDO8432514.1 DNA gyrase subunit A [Candidatus Binatus sp.]